MKTVYLVRHGQSEGNLGDHYQGFETPLTELGVRQAQHVAGRCAKLPVDALIASTMKRAHQTAEIIADRIGKTIISSELFTERVRPSALVGLKIGDPAADAIEKAWDQSLIGIGEKVSDGESFEDIVARAGKAFAFLDDLKEEHILVVTHGYFLRTLLAYALFGQALTGRELAHVIYTFRTENTGITVLTNDSKSDNFHWRLRVFNDHAHLG